MVSRSELATRLARDGASHAQAAHAVDAVLHEITAALVAGERVALTGFGTFEPVARSARTARNPRTGAAVEVAATTVARFRPGVQLREALVSGDAGVAPAGRLPAAARPAAPAAVPTETESRPRATDEAASIGTPGTASTGSGKVEPKPQRKSKPKDKPTSSKHADSAKPAKGKKGKKLATTKGSSGSAKSRGARKSSKGKH
ncbi:HU family DNA-binding protein [Cellulomonas sp. SG140]|uniref:HU family DNA-binding protein n=1 Tax=Cellulomonas sp. SG140 TaxID=2976536 RepID=UPI0021E73A7D|nr:HU family DNA-binding protein [Cellulomonas sp. SG140]